jgi:uncharacterized protein (DUF58 family)
LGAGYYLHPDFLLFRWLAEIMAYACVALLLLFLSNRVSDLRNLKVSEERSEIALDAPANEVVEQGFTVPLNSSVNGQVFDNDHNAFRRRSIGLQRIDDRADAGLESGTLVSTGLGLG